MERWVPWAHPNPNSMTCCPRSQRWVLWWPHPNPNRPTYFTVAARAAASEGTLVLCPAEAPAGRRPLQKVAPLCLLCLPGCNRVCTPGCNRAHPRLQPRATCVSLLRGRGPCRRRCGRRGGRAASRCAWRRGAARRARSRRTGRARGCTGGRAPVRVRVEWERCGSTGSEGGGGVAPPGGVVARRGITRAPSASHPHPSLTAAPRLYRQDRVERYVDCRDDDHGAARAREALDLVGRLDLRLLELEREQVHAGHGHAWPCPARGHAPSRSLPLWPPLCLQVQAPCRKSTRSLPRSRDIRGRAGRPQ